MKIYELLVLVDPAFAQKNEGAGPKLVQSLIEKCGGEVIRIEKYADQKLAYEIRNNKRGVYVLVAFRMDPQRVIELDREFRLDEHVLRNIVLDRTGLTVDKFFKRYEETEESRAEVAEARSGL